MKNAFYFECFDNERQSKTTVGAIARSFEEARVALIARYPQCTIADRPYHTRKSMGAMERLLRA